MPHALCACGNPCAISLPRADLAGSDGPDLIRHLVTSYFALGGMHVHFNMVSADDLRAAKTHPEQYVDLTIRVSEYSARFVMVEDTWQNALIERADQGM
jgi:formate C-acetyltransferase